MNNSSLFLDVRMGNVEVSHPINVQFRMFISVQFRDGMNLRLGNAYFPLFLCFLRGGVCQAIPISFLLSREFILFLVCELSREHEMCI